MQQRFEFTQNPTPLRFATDPTTRSAMLAVKDDGQAGALYGGNKVRKLEYLLADAKNRGASRAITCGAIGSNHCLATALYANEVGMTAELHHFPQEVTEHVHKNLLALATLDVELIHHDAIEPWLQAIRSCPTRADVESNESYWIPAGGTTPLGALGFVDAAIECVSQYRAANVQLPDYVYVPVGTAGTLIGLALGFALERAATTVVGVQVTPPGIVSEAEIERLGQQTAALLRARGQQLSWDDARWAVRRDFLGPGYGIPTDAGRQAIRWSSEVLGLELESTYTAKCVAALVHDLNDGRLREKSVLYWYTLNQVSLPSTDRADARAALPLAYHGYL